MIIRFPGCYPVQISGSLAHWEPNGTHHGPKSNPALMAAKFVKLECSPWGLWGTHIVEKFPALLNLPMSEGWRLWMYFRGGYAWHCDIYIDRRDLATERGIMA